MKKFLKIFIFVFVLAFSQISFGAAGEGIRNLPYGSGFFVGAGGSLSQIKINLNGATFTSGASTSSVFSGGNDIVEARIYELNGQVVNCILTGFANGVISANNCPNITKSNEKGYYVSFVTKFGNFGAVELIASNSNSNLVSNNSMEVKGIIYPYISMFLSSNYITIGTGGIMEIGSNSISQSGTEVFVTTNTVRGYSLYSKATNFSNGTDIMPFDSPRNISNNPSVSAFGTYINSIKNPANTREGFNQNGQITTISAKNNFGLGSLSNGVISNNFQEISSSDGNLLTGSIVFKCITGVSPIQTPGQYSSYITFRAVGNF